MLVTIALQVFGQVNSDSILVSKSELKKQIDLNDKHKAQWKYCVETITKADSVVVASRRYIASLDTVIALKDETITLLTEAKNECKSLADKNRIAYEKNLKLQKRKGFMKTVTVGTLSATISSIVTAVAVFFGIK